MGFLFIFPLYFVCILFVLFEVMQIKSRNFALSYIPRLFLFFILGQDLSVAQAGLQFTILLPQPPKVLG